MTPWIVSRHTKLHTPTQPNVREPGVRRCIVLYEPCVERNRNEPDGVSSLVSLTPRERQVMALVVSGLLNKQVGGELGISEITVKAHRGQVMQKMKANSVADLVKMAGRLRLSAAANA